MQESTAFVDDAVSSPSSGIVGESEPAWRDNLLLYEDRFGFQRNRVGFYHNEIVSGGKNYLSGAGILFTSLSTSELAALVLLSPRGIAAEA